VSYPFVIWETERAEIIACGPHRYRLIWDGNYVAKFSSCFHAALYLNQEFEQ
jgi:hypothetical protein